MKNINLTIRNAHRGDIDKLYEIEKLCYDKPWSLESFISEIELKDYAVNYIAECDGEIVGYLLYNQIFEQAHIMNVAVSPKHRGSGIGKALMQKIFEDSEEKNIETYVLECKVGNEAAIRLYESFGFIVVGKREGYYNGEDALIMWRDIN